MKNKEYSIGEEFEYEGVRLKCVKDVSEIPCNGCYFDVEEFPCFCRIDFPERIECLGFKRKDKTDVVFVEVEE